MQDDPNSPAAGVRPLAGVAGLPTLGVTLRMLEVFVLVIERRTMTAAAEQLNLTQAAVSQSITAMEQALRVKVFDRSVRPPLLTLVGQSVHQHALQILGDAHRLEDEMRYSGSGQLPLLRIGMLDSFAATAGVEMLSRLRDLAYEWTIASGFRATGIPALLERRSDVIITSDETPVPPEVEALPICSEPFVLAAPASFRGDLKDIRQLGGALDFIRYGRDAHMLTRIQSYLERSGLKTAGRYQFDTTDAVVRMVAGGFGWTIMTPLILLKSTAQPEAIRIVPLPPPAMRRTLIVAMRRGEGRDIARQIRATAISILQDQVMPRLAQAMPQVAGEVRVAGRGRKSAG
jgi:DNA-binding transcriptional LysR family regulator